LSSAKLRHLHSFVATKEYFALIPIPNVIQHGIASIGQEGADKLKRCYFFTVFEHPLNNLTIFSKILELGHKVFQIIFLSFILKKVL
jgi:hypothetical protein